MTWYEDEQYRKKIALRYRPVSWGRLYWKRSNPRNRMAKHFNEKDVAIIRLPNGSIEHYTTHKELIREIEEWGG